MYFYYAESQSFGIVLTSDNCLASQSIILLWLINLRQNRPDQNIIDKIGKTFMAYKIILYQWVFLSISGASFFVIMLHASMYMTVEEAEMIELEMEEVQTL